MKTIVIFLIIGLTLLVSWQLYGAYVTNKSPNIVPELIGVKNGIIFKKYLNYQKASVSIDDMSSSNGKFSILANYIFGGNQDEVQISMTSPVVFQMDTLSTFSFIMPESWLGKELPKPNNDNIFFDVVKNQYVAVLEFGGYAKQEICVRRHREMSQVLQNLGININDSYSVAVYQAPYQVLNRKNEIWIELNESQIKQLFPN